MCTPTTRNSLVHALARVLSTALPLIGDPIRAATLVPASELGQERPNVAD